MKTRLNALVLSLAPFTVHVAAEMVTVLRDHPAIFSTGPMSHIKAGTRLRVIAKRDNGKTYEVSYKINGRDIVAWIDANDVKRVHEPKQNGEADTASAARQKRVRQVPAMSQEDVRPATAPVVGPEDLLDDPKQSVSAPVPADSQVPPQGTDTAQSSPETSQRALEAEELEHLLGRTSPEHQPSTRSVVDASYDGHVLVLVFFLVTGLFWVAREEIKRKKGNADENAKQKGTGAGDEQQEKKAGKEKAGKEKAGKEKAGKEKAGKEKAGKEKAGKEKAGKEKAGKEKAERKKAGKKKGIQPSLAETRFARTLKLEGRITKEDIRMNYRELIKKYHPDKVQHLGDEFKELARVKAQEIIEAYEYFRNKYKIE